MKTVFKKIAIPFLLMKLKLKTDSPINSMEKIQLFSRLGLLFKKFNKKPFEKGMTLPHGFHVDFKRPLLEKKNFFNIKIKIG